VLEASERLATSLADPVFGPSHRDCYADKVMVNGSWLYLIDLDLYCMADPALDIGNFIGHVTEFALRSCGKSDALVHLEQSMEESYLANAGEAMRAAIGAYATLTLVRHIAISQRIPERRGFTPALLELCECRLGIMAA
jgi:thiamine kinase-like enzyme